MMLEVSHEFGKNYGLGFVKGEVIPIPPSKKNI